LAVFAELVVVTYTDTDRYTDRCIDIQTMFKLQLKMLGIIFWYTVCI